MDLEGLEDLETDLMDVYIERETIESEGGGDQKAEKSRGATSSLPIRSIMTRKK